MTPDNTLTRENLRLKCEEAMKDKAVTSISGWTEPNSDKPCDEEEYRQRLQDNGQIFIEKIKEALSFE